MTRTKGRFEHAYRRAEQRTNDATLDEELGLREKRLHHRRREEERRFNYMHSRVKCTSDRTGYGVMAHKAGKEGYAFEWRERECEIARGMR